MAEQPDPEAPESGADSLQSAGEAEAVSATDQGGSLESGRTREARTRPVADDSLRLAQQMAATSAGEALHNPSTPSPHASAARDSDGTTTRKFTHRELFDAMAENDATPGTVPPAASGETEADSGAPESEEPESLPTRTSDYTMQLTGADLEDVMLAPSPSLPREVRSETTTAAAVSKAPPKPGPDQSAQAQLGPSEREIKSLYRLTMEPMVITLEQLLLDGQLEAALALVRALKKTL